MEEEDEEAALIVAESIAKRKDETKKNSVQREK